MHQIYQGNCFPEGTDPTVEGFNPLAAVLDYYHINVGSDNGEFNGSPDQANWDRWTGQDTSTERRAPPEQEAIVA